MTCPTCVHADRTGSWPQELLNQGGTHCRDCHRSWVSKVEAHCVTCHIQFSTNRTADLHDPYCSVDTAETMRRCRAARTGSGKPILRVRPRRWGSVLVSWSPADAQRPVGVR